MHFGVIAQCKNAIRGISNYTLPNSMLEFILDWVNLTGRLSTFLFFKKT